MADTAPANPAGVAAIVPRIIPAAGMEVGVNRKITDPADVPVIPAGVAAIVRKRWRQPVAGMEHGYII